MEYKLSEACYYRSRISSSTVFPIIRIRKTMIVTCQIVDKIPGQSQPTDPDHDYGSHDFRDCRIQVCLLFRSLIRFFHRF